MAALVDDDDDDAALDGRGFERIAAVVKKRD